MLIDNYINYLKEEYDVYEEGLKDKLDRRTPEQKVRAERNREDDYRAVGQAAMKGLKKAAIGTVAAPLYMKGMKAGVKKLNPGLPGEMIAASLPNITHKQAAKLGLMATGAYAGKAYAKNKIKHAREAIKEKRAKKAQQVAVEECVSLDEAYEFILGCEQMLLDEGYELHEIYED